MLIQFEDPRDAEDAIRGRDGYKFDGYRLRVSLLTCHSTCSLYFSVEPFLSCVMHRLLCMGRIEANYDFLASCRLNWHMVREDILHLWTAMAATVAVEVAVEELAGTLTIVVCSFFIWCLVETQHSRLKLKNCNNLCCSFGHWITFFRIMAGPEGKMALHVICSIRFSLLVGFANFI